jgi:hypothetical protein
LRNLLIIKGKIPGPQTGAGRLLRCLAAGWIVSAGLLTGGCMVGPDYQRPRVNLPAGYGAQAAPPEGWKLAQPAEEAALNPAASPASRADALRWRDWWNRSR